jgi:hypothetical protein
MKLITYYIAISLIADVIAAVFCLAVEKVVPWLSMPLFLSLYFLILWGAWVVSVRLTEPKSAPALGATSDQRA